MSRKEPPCDVTLEFSTSSPLTKQQRAFYEAIRKVVERFDHQVSLRAYVMHAPTEQKPDRDLGPPSGPKKRK